MFDISSLCAHVPLQGIDWRAIGTKDSAMRWVLEAPELSLPSEDQKSFQAMLALRGRPEWWDRQLTQDANGFSVARKLELLKTGHLQSMHLGGRDAITRSLKEAVGDQLWSHADKDAAWIVLRCEHCRQNTIRGHGSWTNEAN